MLIRPDAQMFLSMTKAALALPILAVTSGIHPSRTSMSESFESVRWNACMHRLDIGLYSHLKEFWGNGVTANCKGKIPSTGKILNRGGWIPRRMFRQDSEPNRLPTSYPGPQSPYVVPRLGGYALSSKRCVAGTHLV